MGNEMVVGSKSRWLQGRSRFKNTLAVREIGTMKTLGSIILALSIVSMAHAAEDVVSAVHGTIEKVDPVTKTLVVKAEDGTDHSLHLLDTTTVHGVRASAEAGTDSWQGLKDGTEVVAHYSRRGTKDTALEVDNVGKDGLKATEGTIKGLDRGGKKMVVKTADGTESTFRLTDDAAKDAGKGIVEGTEKGTKVTVYYSEDTGEKVAHFFERG
jgi:hypothetical protein